MGGGGGIGQAEPRLVPVPITGLFRTQLPGKGVPHIPALLDRTRLDITVMPAAQEAGMVADRRLVARLACCNRVRPEPHSEGRAPVSELDCSCSLVSALRAE